MNLAALDQVNGPVFVEGAQPGDTLQVDVLRIENPEWGWTALFPGFGLLADEFPEPALKIWKLEQEGFAWFDEKKGMKVPLKPFAGEMGVVQKKKGAFSTIPPYHTGGNIDTKHVTVGSTLFLPVEVEGALFSIGVRMLVDGMICLRNCYHVGWSRRTGGWRYVPEPAAPYDLLIRDYVNRSMWYVRSALTYTRSEN
jgi:acetamidase/formamidase